jgi:hypothetical protein
MRNTFSSNTRYVSSSVAMSTCYSRRATLQMGSDPSTLAVTCLCRTESSPFAAITTVGCSPERLEICPTLLESVVSFFDFDGSGLPLEPPTRLSLE